MDKIAKFLKFLSAKQRKILLKKIFPRIETLQLEGLDVKPLVGHKGLYRIKLGKIRIIFVKDSQRGRGIVVAVDFRKNIYKNL